MMKKLFALLLSVSAVATTICLTMDDVPAKSPRRIPSPDPDPCRNEKALYLLTSIGRFPDTVSSRGGNMG